MTPEIQRKLESVLKSDFDIAKQNIMLRDHDGKYHLFGQFEVQENQDLVEVFRGPNKLQQFSSMKSALSWCIAEKYHQIPLSSEILRLDRDYARLKNTEQVLVAMIGRIKDRERRFIARAKSEDNNYKLTHIQNQLTKCVSRAKYLQLRGFNDEIARTRRPTPNRTSRTVTRKSSR